MTAAVASLAALAILPATAQAQTQETRTLTIKTTIEGMSKADLAKTDLEYAITLDHCDDSSSGGAWCGVPDGTVIGGAEYREATATYHARGDQNLVIRGIPRGASYSICVVPAASYKVDLSWLHGAGLTMCGQQIDFWRPDLNTRNFEQTFRENTLNRDTTETIKLVKRYADVYSNTAHVEDIDWLGSSRISEGWKMPNGSYEFRGMSPVVRQDMAAFLRREAVKRGISDAASWKPSAADRKRFRDVTCTADNKGNGNTPHCEDILWLAHANISEGWKEKDGSSTFRGMDTVKRQDMAAFLKRLAAKAGKGGNVKPKTDFTDVTAGTPHKAEIQWLGGSGISEGYRNANGSWRFEGMTSVYRQDMAAFIHRLDNLVK
ncbi:hypothetical protein [Bifidobacterium pseudolongum]|nr:hypothetical protein [Bifidobacterium pseudolongum]